MAMNYERDRFVAFAFAAADAFLEIDYRGKIKFAAGALDWLAGQDRNDLIGRDLEGYCSGRSRKILRAAAESAMSLGRFGPITVRFRGAGGNEKPIAVYGTCLPDYPDSAFLSLKAASNLGLNLTAAANIQDDEPVLLEVEAFKDLAASLITQIQDGKDELILTLIEVKGLEETLFKLDREVADDLKDRIAAHLSAASLEGVSAGQFSKQSFGLIHGADLDVAAAMREIQTFENGDSLESNAKSIVLDGAELSEADRLKSLIYAIDVFWDDPEECKFGSLSEGYKSLLASTRSRLTVFRRVLAEQQFDIVVQPVVGLNSKKVHHYEALARFEAKDIDTLPREFIADAEDLGVICDFDIAMCRRIVERIEKAGAAGKSLAMSINVSSVSLATDRFVTELLILLKGHDEIRRRLIFEVTEATKIKDIEATERVLSQISRLGHPICLDDFGTGEHGYQYLRALPVNFVKIDGVHVKKAFTDSNARALLRSMAKLCREIEVRTVGEAVEMAPQAKFLRDIGVEYGQGYFFGKPSVGISDNPGPFSF